MTKSELIDRLLKFNPHLRHREAEQVVETIFEKISETLAEDGRVEIRGFGVFFVKKRKPRKGRNPRTGETVQVEGKLVPFFKAGLPMRERLNGIVPSDNNAQE